VGEGEPRFLLSHREEHDCLLRPSAVRRAAPPRTTAAASGEPAMADGRGPRHKGQAWSELPRAVASPESRALGGGAGRQQLTPLRH